MPGDVWLKFSFPNSALLLFLSFPPFEKTPTRPLPLHPCVIVLNGASSRLALPSAGGERGAAGAGGGVCCGGQSRLAFAAEPHMFTGSIQPVEPQLGGSRPRTGARSSSRSWSHRTAVFTCFQDIPKDR